MSDIILDSFPCIAQYPFWKCDWKQTPACNSGRKELSSLSWTLPCFIQTWAIWTCFSPPYKKTSLSQKIAYRPGVLWPVFHYANSDLLFHSVLGIVSFLSSHFQSSCSPCWSLDPKWKVQCFVSMPFPHFGSEPWISSWTLELKYLAAAKHVITVRSEPLTVLCPDLQEWGRLGPHCHALSLSSKVCLSSLPKLAKVKVALQHIQYTHSLLFCFKGDVRAGVEKCASETWKSKYFQTLFATHQDLI